MRLPVMAAVFTASALLSMVPPSEWAIRNLADGLEAPNAKASEMTYFVGGKSIRGLAMSPGVSAAVSALAGSSSDQYSAREIEKRLKTYPVEKVIEALATSSGSKNWFRSSSVRKLINNMKNLSTCSTETESKRSTCGLGIPSCVEACDGGLWPKPAPGSCHLVCTIAQEHCTRCNYKRERDTHWSGSAQDSGAKSFLTGLIQATFNVDLPRHLWLYALSMLLAIAGFVYQSVKHARQIYHISDQVDAKLAKMKDDFRDLIAETLMENMEQLREKVEQLRETMEQLRREHAHQMCHISDQVDAKLAKMKYECRDLIAEALRKEMEQLRREHVGHDERLGAGAGMKSLRDISVGTEEGEEGRRDDNEEGAKGDEEGSGTIDVEVVGGDGDDGGIVAQAAAEDDEAPAQENANLVDAAVAFAYGWARDRVGI